MPPAKKKNSVGSENVQRKSGAAEVWTSSTRAARLANPTAATPSAARARDPRATHPTSSATSGRTT